MASAVGVRSEHTVKIDGSKETDCFLSLFYEQTQYIIERKEGLENDDDDSRMPFPILCIFL